MAFTISWNSAYEKIPADEEALSLGAGRIRALKVDIKERANIDHDWSDGAGGETGYHKKVTLKEQVFNPAAVADTGIIFSKDVGGITELFYINSAGNVIQLTSLTIPNSSFPSGTKIVFWQAAAPTGWQASTGLTNDSALRLVTSGGGTVTNRAKTFTGAFAANQGTSATDTSHAHTFSATTGTPSSLDNVEGGAGDTPAGPIHTHIVSGTTSFDGASHLHVFSLDVHYADVRIFEKI